MECHRTVISYLLVPGSSVMIMPGSSRGDDGDEDEDGEGDAGGRAWRRW